MDGVEGLTSEHARSLPPVPAPGGKAGPPAPSPYVRPDLYDMLFESLDFDLGLYTTLARAAKGPVLELACGTGRVMIPMLQTGADVEGVDLFPTMIERCKAKARAEGFTPRIHHATMAAFEIPRRFAVIVIPFNAFAHNLTSEEQLACLSRCARHLQPGGQLVIDVFSPSPAMLAEAPGVRTLELEASHAETGLPVRLYDSRTLDPVRQIQHSVIEIEALDARGSVAAVDRFETDTRWVWPVEMHLLLRAAGFARWSLWGTVDRTPLTGDTGDLIVEAWVP